MHGTIYADRVSWAVLLCSYFYACNTVQRGQFLMTSEERHEARYQRRVKKRQERRLALSKSCGDFEDVFSYENLYQSGHICCRGVSWKSSTQTYRFNLVTNTQLAARFLTERIRAEALLSSTSTTEGKCGTSGVFISASASCRERSAIRSSTRP